MFEEMNDKERHVLSNYQHLMKPHEKIIARWLTEEWDEISMLLPGWVRGFVWHNFPSHDPNDLARTICLRLLQEHKQELSLRD